MANGFCPAVLAHINDVAEGNAPGRKLHIAGFLSALFCCQNSSVSPLNTEQFDGAHLRPLTVKYSQRPLISEVQSTDNCDIDRLPVYAEWTIPGLSYKQHSFFLADNVVQQYCADASARRTTGAPPTQVMQEVYDRMLESANVVMKAINVDLVTSMATQFGENVTTNSDNGKYINITPTPSVQFNNGWVDFLKDLWENEICDDICLVGGGNWVANEIQQAALCCNNAGLDMSRLGIPRLFRDKDTESIWGANSAGVFAKGSVKFIGRNRYQGSFAGLRGGSFFTTMAMPVQEFGCNLDECLRDLVFDVQLKFIDCPGEYDVNGVPTALGRGWQVIISKYYALWVQPTTAYASGDPLENTNGTLKYFLTNTTYSGPAYGYP